MLDFILPIHERPGLAGYAVGWGEVMRTVLMGPALALLLTRAFAQDQEPAVEPGKIAVELNKLEAADKACRAYFVIENATDTPLAKLELDLFLFNKEGVILRGTILPFADVPVGRPSIALFEFTGLACGEIGRLVMNKVLACTRSGGKPLENCPGLVIPATRTEVAFE